MIYLDYQATTPVAPEVTKAMQPWIEEKFANPHSPSRWGREADAAIEVARDEVEKAIGLKGGSVAFTGSATEALNWALKGTVEKGKDGRKKIITVATEHAAVLDSCEWLEGQGAEVTVLPVGADGLLDLDRLAAELDDRVVLVVVMLVNNEIGVLQPVSEIAKMARNAGALTLCDAAQALGRVDIPAGPDLVAVSAHKIHGPKAIGALWMKRRGAGALHPWRRAGAGHALGNSVARTVRGVRRRGQARPGTLRPRPRSYPEFVGRGDARARRGLDGQRQHRPPLSRQSQYPPRGRRRGATDRRFARNRFLTGQRVRQRFWPAEPRAERLGATTAKHAPRSASASAATPSRPSSPRPAR